MGTNIERVIGSWWLIMLVIILDAISKGCVEGLQSLDYKNFKPKPKGTIKTIKVTEDGDIIDCVNIYKQPAFDNPLIKELKMVPSISFMKLVNKTIDPQPRLIQNWLKYGECPEGTIPLRRNRNNNNTYHRKYPNFYPPTHHEYAIASQEGNIYHGAGAVFNLWNPYVRSGEFSLAQMWIASGRQTLLNTIEVGWIVYPQYFHDSNTRFFTFWTGDAYQRTGCYNLACAGFVQTDRSFVLGGTLPVSMYGAQPNEIAIKVAKDLETSNWWLQVNGKQIGYFPSSLFTSMQKGADLKVAFGGEIVNFNIGNRHTTTDMGSGHFPLEGYKKASYIRNIVVVREEPIFLDASLVSVATSKQCYNLQLGPPKTHWKSHFYFGGPGYSNNCP